MHTLKTLEIEDMKLTFEEIFKKSVFIEHLTEKQQKELLLNKQD